MDDGAVFLFGFWGKTVEETDELRVKGFYIEAYAWFRDRVLNSKLTNCCCCDVAGILGNM